MKTTLKLGDYIAYRYRGKLEYAEIVSGAPHDLVVAGHPAELCIRPCDVPPAETIIHHGVWKKDNEFIPRRCTISRGPANRTIPDNTGQDAVDQCKTLCDEQEAAVVNALTALSHLCGLGTPMGVELARAAAFGQSVIRKRQRPRFIRKQRT